MAQAVILVPVLVVLLSVRQERLYQASADVLISRQNLSAQLNGTSDPTQYVSPERLVDTQAKLARVGTVAKRALRSAGLAERDADDLLDRSSVSAEVNADLLVFKVTDNVPALAQRLAAAYAREYTIYRRELDTSALRRARVEVSGRLRQLKREGEAGTVFYSSLAEKEQQLRTLEALQTSNASVVQVPEGAEQTQPRPVRAGILGFGLGVLLGIALAFLWEALDTRVRSADEIGQRLKLPLLGRLPEPPRGLRSDDKLVMLEDPGGIEAEAFRILRTNIEFANLDLGAKTIMITSAMQGEGKSTTAANLAVAMARSGRHVVLADLDLRRPYLAKFFELDGPGITDVALAHAEIFDAAVPVAISEPRTRNRPLAQNGSGAVRGVLEVVGSGPLPPDPGEFVGTRALSELLVSLAERADVLLIDSPPLLGLGDALTLSAKVDAILIVTRLNVMRRPLLNELHRILEGCPAAKLGFVLADANAEEGYGAYGYHYSSYYYGQKEKEAVT